MLGESDSLTVEIRVVNKGEDAFGAGVYVPVPEGLAFQKFVDLDNSSVKCWLRDEYDEGPVVICDIGNPLPKHIGVSKFLKSWLLINC